MQNDLLLVGIWEIDLLQLSFSQMQNDLLLVGIWEIDELVTAVSRKRSNTAVISQLDGDSVLPLPKIRAGPGLMVQENCWSEKKKGEWSFTR